ncbi:hypothetical protein HPB48_011721 [Haemaphysalis longicornis]|uniref:Uncharacterized protein n=1 Tax=Haemaphysalis longicornis TaxID=44386 RepID=A0A9J6GTW0_HAELO|nr:hypothetical protein HPB48_011721 [Haemaphysalis longicornis]
MAPDSPAEASGRPLRRPNQPTTGYRRSATRAPGRPRPTPSRTCTTRRPADWKYVQNGGGAVPDVEEGVVTDNDEPLLGSIVLEDGANAAGQGDAADSTTNAASAKDGGAPSPFNGLSESRGDGDVDGLVKSALL